MKKKFKWPCESREAHPPHPLMKMGTIQGLPTGIKVKDGECLGVKAHPFTMIGGNYAPEQIEEHDE